MEDRFQQALDYIYSFIDYERTPKPRDAVNYDLRRMDELLGRAGNPHLKARTVHVAGTKGKGSVSSMIASALTGSGYVTGLFTSPHLHIFNERIRVDGNLISDDEVVCLVDRLKPEVAAVNEKATYGKITTFELITALGFAYFEMKKADFQVVEVGLGGRLDATNVVKPDLCVITSISRDHTEVLGNELAGIAAEKAGIIKTGSVVVSAPQVPEVGRVIERVCRETNSELITVGRDVTWELLGFDLDSQKLRIKGQKQTCEVSIPLLGGHQLINAAVAVAALERLSAMGFKVNAGTIQKGLAGVKWPGRLEVLNRNPLVVVDGAHNPDSAGVLKRALKDYFSYRKAVLIIGSSSDKDISGMISELGPVFDEVIVTHSIHPRATPTERMAAEFLKQGVTAHQTEDISQALPLAMSLAGPEDLICVTGSLFVVAGAIEQAGVMGLKK